MNWHHHNDQEFDFHREQCCVVIEPEVGYGIGDEFVCPVNGFVVCSGEDCAKTPCERHAKQCTQCGQFFCESTDKRLSTCFHEHVKEGACKGQIFRIPLDHLSKALNSGQHDKLKKFVTTDSDGLGNPLPTEVCQSFNLAVNYFQGVIPEYNPDVLKIQELNTRQRRAKRQKIRRAEKRLNISASIAHTESTRLASYKGSTFHVVNAALIVHRWTGAWHYREQLEILSIMGLHKGNDFVRNRVDYLCRSNPMLFQQVEKFASSIAQRHRH